MLKIKQNKKKTHEEAKYFFSMKIFVLFFSEFRKLENVGYVTKGKTTI